jgi:hypothetical protein
MSDLSHLELLQFGNGVFRWITLNERGICLKAAGAAVGIMGTHCLRSCKVNESHCIALLPPGLAYAEKVIALDLIYCCGGHRCHFLSFVSMFLSNHTLISLSSGFAIFFYLFFVR